MRLTWKPSVFAAAVHVARACVQYPGLVVDPEIFAAMAPLAHRLTEWMPPGSPVEPSTVLWEDWLALASRTESTQAFAEAVVRLQGAEDGPINDANGLASLLKQIEGAFLEWCPRYSDQFPLRMRPLQEQWLGYGRGLLTQIQRSIGLGVSQESCEIVGVQPVMGGFGCVHRNSGQIFMESLLTNVRHELPEVVRLAWLLAQWAIDPERVCESDRSGCLSLAIPLATIPPVLAAAEKVELARFDRQSVALALEVWRVATPQAIDSREDLADILADGWRGAADHAASWEQWLGIMANRLRG